ncbi:unnamed protein product, partial [Cladocopium goreaui]
MSSLHPADNLPFSWAPGQLVLVPLVPNRHSAVNQPVVLSTTAWLLKRAMSQMLRDILLEFDIMGSPG